MGDNIELARLAELSTLGVMDTAAEPEFDRLTAIAARLLHTPVALLSFFDERRQWFKSAFGADLRESPREDAICWHMVQASEPQPMVVLDALRDDRFKDNPYVATKPGARFYAGVPVMTLSGICIGALCAIDYAPREQVMAEDVEAMRLLADMAAEMLHDRLQAALQLEATRRAMLADGLLSAVATSDDCATGLTSASRLLAEHSGARMRQIWQRRSADDVTERVDLPSVQSLLPLWPGPAEPSGLSEPLHRLIDTALSRREVTTLELTSDREPARDAGPGPDGMAEAGGLELITALPIAVGCGHAVLVFGYDDPAEGADFAASFASLQTILETSLARKTVEQRYRLLSSALDMATDGIAVTEVDPRSGDALRMVYVNRRLCDLTGQNASDLIGRAPDVFDVPGSDAVQEEFRRALQIGFSPPALVTMFRAGGPSPQVEIETAGLRDPNGRITHVVSMHRDVTKRLSEERKKREVTQSFRLLFDSNPLPMWIFHRRTLQFLMVNDAAVHFYGWPREEFLKKTLRSIKPDSDWPELDRIVETGFCGVADGHVFTHYRADGTTVRMGTVIRPHPALDEEAMVSALWDMTAVQAAREELARSNLLLSDLASQLKARTEELTDAHRLAQLGTWRLSADRRTMTWSDEIYNLIGRTRDDYPSTLQNAYELFHPEDRHLFRSRLEMAEAGVVAPRLDARIIRSDGRLRHVKIDYRVADDGSIAGYMQDWSERWETEQALMRSEKLAILGQVTGGVAHDFNNLLTVITLNLEESIEDLPEDDELQTILVPALQASRRCAELTNQLLAYSRQAPLRPQAINLDTFFGSCRPMIRRALGKHHDLVLEVSDGRAAPLVDASQLQTALVNLALNARDAMPHGGELSMTATTATLPSAEFEIDDAAPGDYAVISVTDTGVGIPPDIANRVFEPFFTTKGEKGNSGLGLSMVDGFVRQSGGYTQVRSVPGQGTTIRLFLPLAAVEEGKQHPTTTRPRVLVVDDQPAVLATVTRMLNQLGYDVCAVSSAAAALAELERDRNFSVLFTDIILPGGMDGFALSKIVRSRVPQIQILLTSGYSEKDLSQSGVPGVDILAKPYKRKDLLERLTALTG
jgi:PAS domain S-box-containing protein